VRGLKFDVARPTPLTARIHGGTVKRTIDRREFGLGLLGTAAAVLPALPRLARAEGYPTRPVRIIVGAPAGSGPDIAARLIGQWLSKRLGQQFIVENRTGAGGNIATAFVAEAPRDGYTLLMVVSANAVNATLYTNLSFNFVRDIAPVGTIGGAPYVMVANPSLPSKDLVEFIAYAKANPGKINMASTGNGSSNQIFGELFKMMAGVDMVHVPYRGSLMPDLLAGQVQIAFTSIPYSIEYIRAGKLRALAVTTARRVDVLPEVPAVAESVPGYQASGWYGIGVPKATSPEIIDELNKAVNASLTDAKIDARLADLGVQPMAMTPAEFGKFIGDETEKWGKVVRAANIKAE
jgi:tripartite-type tricarboxylate transporter receptor subunit TctC